MTRILLGVASTHSKEFNQAQASPMDGKTKGVKQFPDWSLNNYIDVASEIGILKQDVKKFSHAIRGFRNYIHPYQQKIEKFMPDEHTALICFQVLKAAIFQIGEYVKTEKR